MRQWFLAAVAAAALTPALPGQEQAGVGRVVPDFTLTEPLTGQDRSLDGLLEGKRAAVVVFMGTVCPVNNQYMPTLNAIVKEYADKGVAVIGVNSNHADGPEAVAAHARESGLIFPVLKDTDGRVADSFGAKITPEAFLLDSGSVLRYRGRIDDQFAREHKKLRATQRDLVAAVEEVLAGKPVTNPVTEPEGCYISRPPAREKAGATVTYTRDIAPIINAHCLECHRSGQIAPMALTDYESVAAWGATVAEVVGQRFMPPWYADPKFGHFANERRVPDNQVELLRRWVDQGCPEGDPKDLPPAPTFDNAEWKIGTPDLVLEMPQEYEVPAETPQGGIPYQYFIINPNFEEDVYISKAEAKAGADSVVHHIIAFVVPPYDRVDPELPTFPFLPGVRHAQVLCGTAPGDMPIMLPEGTARFVPAGSLIVFQMHYTPNGVAAKDRSKIGLSFAKGKVEKQVQALPVFNERFRIPPGDPHHEVQSRFMFKRPGRILSLMPHMHLRGADFKLDVFDAAGKSETILSIPQYNFNWQLSYRLKEPIDIPAGGGVHCTAHFDNSAENPHNPDPTKEVRWGDQTWQEMMIGWVDVVWDLPAE